MGFEITPLAEPLGAEIRGWNPDLLLDDEEFDQISRALRKHLVLIFRGQPTPAENELISFGKRFGELALGGQIFGDLGDHPEILAITNIRDDAGDPIGTASSAALRFHLDYSYLPRVAKETFLEAIEIPDSPCPTYFCDTYRALETLPPEWIKRIRDLSASHDVRGAVPDQDMHLIEDETTRKRLRNKRIGVPHERIPSTKHPIIRQHPDSGREMLYVSPGMTTHAVGLKDDESRSLLEFLHGHQIQEERTYKHQWEVGDLIVFDAMGVMHARDGWDPKVRRHMRQMSTLA